MIKIRNGGCQLEFKKVQFKTGKLNEMKDFYRDILGFTLIKETEESFQITMGTTLVEFSNEAVEGQPFYHFACDIPANQFRAAKLWLQNRTELLTEDGEDEVYFKFIDAFSIYFTDPSNNIVEFIARNNEYPETAQSFTLHSLQKLSEVGLVVENKREAVELLKPYDIVNRESGAVSESSLSFFGDHQNPVYLLLVNEGRKWLFSQQKSICYPIDILLDSNISIRVRDNKQLTIEKRADEF